MRAFAGYLSTVMFTCAPVLAGVAPIAPFGGDASEPLNQPFTLIAASIDLFGGAGRLHSFNDVATTIHLLASDTFIGDVVTPHTGGKVIGFTQGPAWFEFDQPIAKFGAWWNNNSGTNDAKVDFFDIDGKLIGTATAIAPAPGNAWTWNGWQSDVPISTIRVTGFGALQGFLWFDDLEIAYLARACAADLSDDGQVDGGDLGLLLTNWGSNGAGDLNGDGTTDAKDLAELLAAWGRCSGG